MGGIEIRRVDEGVPQLTDDARGRIEALGFVPVGAFLVRTLVETEADAGEAFLDAHDRDVLRRVARGVVVEVWSARDDRTLAEVSAYHEDLAWSLVSLLRDGTLVRTSSHSARDSTRGGLMNPRAAGYDRLDLVDAPLDDLVARHGKRIDAAAPAEREPLALHGDDWAHLTRRACEVVNAVGATASAMAAAVVLGGGPLLAASVGAAAWGGGWLGACNASLLACSVLIVMVGGAFLGPVAVFRALMVAFAPFVRGERVPGEEVCKGRALGTWWWPD